MHIRQFTNLVEKYNKTCATIKINLQFLYEMNVLTLSVNLQGYIITTLTGPTSKSFIENIKRFGFSEANTISLNPF